jgi:aspartyl protease family protein
MRPVEDAPDEPPLTAGIYRNDGRIVRSSLGALGLCCAGTIIFGLAVRMVLPSSHPPAPPVAAPRPAASAPAHPSAAASRQPPNTLVYRADANGHFVVDASINAAPIHLVVDTGATKVVLTPADARAAGINMAALNYSETVTTANGSAHAAPVTLRAVRLGSLSVDNVPALVMDNALPVSLLGMSFLRRLDGYSIHDGVLTIDW